jgi:hypothetical protein
VAVKLGNLYMAKEIELELSMPLVPSWWICESVMGRIVWCDLLLIVSPLISLNLSSM